MAQMSPEEKVLYGDTPTPAAPSASSLSPQEQQLITGSAPPQPPSVQPADPLESFQAGTLSGIGDVAGGIQRLFGFNPTLSTATQNKLTAEQKAGMAAHPWASGFGRTFGQTAVTLPATLATAYALPEAGLTGLGALIARGGYTGALTGAENALLTSGQNPQEPLPERAIKGAYWGLPFGMLGGGMDRLAGAGQTITPPVQQAGQRMQGAGVDVLPTNLPRTEAPAAAQGASPTATQTSQLNQGWGRIYGENTPDFTAATTGPSIARLGNDVGNAVRGGTVDYDIPLTTAATQPGQTFEQRLAEIEADNVGVPQIKRLISGPQGILARVDASGNIPGTEIEDLLKTNNPLDRATRNATPQIADPANEIEAAIHDAFGQSSTPAQAEAYRLAREKYKLAIAGENAADPVTGNLDPSRLITTVQRMYPDAKRLGTGTSLTDQAVQYARDAAHLFGGQGGAPAPVMAHGGWAMPGALSALTAAGAGVADVAPHLLPWMLPTALQNPLVTGGAIGGPIAYRLGSNLLRGYQNTPGFAANLLTRGSSPAPPYLGGTMGSWGASLPNQQWGTP